MADWNVLFRKKQRVISLAICLLILMLVLFWKNLLVASPMFFGYRGDDLFGIYTASLNGKGFRAILLDSRREMTHARLSPDKKHITFTRYNRVLKDGLCEENGSDYLHTEVIVADADGKHQRSVESVGPEIMSANSSWVDNDSIIYIYKANLKALPVLKIYRLSSGDSVRVPTPPALATSDPHCVGGVIVFPVIPLNDKNAPCSLWTLNTDGSGLRQITNPNIKPTSSTFIFKIGDYDPWLSADASTVVFMRYYGGTDWRIFTADMKSGSERLLTKPGLPSGIPKWNNKGDLITFVCWDNSKLENLGIYTVTREGTDRKKVPLPGGYMYTHPSFFPKISANDEEMLMISGRRVPGLP